MARKLDFSVIRKYNKQQLYDLGFRQFDKPDKYHLVLMLFPSKYYHQIPEGFRVVNTSGSVNLFTPETIKMSKTDHLDYGIVVMDMKIKEKK